MESAIYPCIMTCTVGFEHAPDTLYTCDRISVSDRKVVVTVSQLRKVDGKLQILEPASKAGSYVEVRADMDCLVAISGCAAAAGKANAGKCKSLHVIM